MANQEQLDILKQGVQAWNEWSVKNQGIEIDLSGADLFRVDLTGADLFGVDLSRANLAGAGLSEANLTLDFLSGTNLRRADLSHATLTRSNLSYTNLIEADLTGADLSKILCSFTDFSRSKLSLANFNDAKLAYTVFGDVDLSTAKELETVKHDGPSTIGIDTIYHSQGKIPEVFLKGAGVPDSFINYMRSLVGSPFDYYSRFISYSSKDEAFAERL